MKARSLRGESVVLRRCDELGAVSDDVGCLTRTFHSAAMQRVNALVGKWMREAGLEMREDAAFNLIGRWPSGDARAKTFLLGSHLDTVRDAGKYDGPLGVLIGLACIERLRAQKIELPFHLELIGFSDEEGVRYQTSYLGSRAMAGTLSRRDLALIEEKGIERARRNRRDIFGYAEVHIEQGPVLEARDASIGVVTAIAGQSRIRVEFEGRAGHAGTTPMNLRRDALCGAAELILAVEKCGVIATVGQLAVEPGASNVIPARAVLSLDIRHAKDSRRIAAISALEAKAEQIAKKRSLRVRWKLIQETAAVACDPELSRLLVQAAKAHEPRLISLPSGAGHDAAAMSALCPVAMLFVCCKGGVSHHPEESVAARDVAQAMAATTDFLLLLKKRCE